MDYREAILEKLMYSPKLRFSDMQIKGMSSKHFTYYLNKLLEEKLIKKKDRMYFLTDNGKDYVARLDEANMRIEQQPKIGVAIFVEREGENGNKEILVNRRLKQPYYGKVGGFTGKVRFGEEFKQTARRELLEETGLTGEFIMSGMIRKFAYSIKEDQKKRVQDQIFVFFRVSEPEGILIKKIKDQENFWIDYEELKKRDDLFNTYLDFLKKGLYSSEIEDFEIEVEAEGY